MLWTILGILFFILVGLALILHIHLTRMKKYWPSRGVEFIGSKEIGGVISNLIKRVHVINLDKKIYKISKQKNQPYLGYLEFSNPVLFMSDLEILRNIFVKDFDHFVDRRDFKANKLDEWTSKMLFFMESDPWKELRAKMSPTFTTGKIRRMFDTIENCGEKLVNFINEDIKKSSTINFEEVYGKYTIDVISNSAFGLESGAFHEKKSMFEKMAEKLQFKMTFKDVITFLIIFILPRFAELIKLPLFNQEACNFFSTTIKNTIKHRQISGEKRDDFLQLMLESKSGQLKTEETELNSFEKDAIVNVKGKVILTDDIICAQSILFFLAGFDTTQTVLEFATYQLSISNEIQEILANEVQRSFKKYGNRFTYESINEMEYMDKFISETLRMYPPIPRLDRRCTKDYTIPGTNLLIKAGTLIVIPSYAIHHDEDIYPDPYRFNPERFSKENKATRSPYAFMPFGQGPRNCIGMRFAITETKLAIAHLVQNFIIEPSEKTIIPMKFAFTTTLKPEGGMWLNLKPRLSTNI